MYHSPLAMRCARYLLVIGLSCLVSCQEKTFEEAAKETLKGALEALNRDDYDAYLQYVDFGTEMDSAQEVFMRNVLKQHLGWQRAERAAVVSIDMIDAQMQSDSVYTVYYQYTFADSTKEVASQKMVRHGEKWKIRLRN
ncbi:MAG: hypothetical protein IJP82_09790 [Bacteroidaceae bacterium]|nr:hypothetical protein [Bacteroidaceae bacterium]